MYVFYFAMKDLYELYIKTLYLSLVYAHYYALTFLSNKFWFLMKQNTVNHILKKEYKTFNVTSHIFIMFNEKKTDVNESNSNYDRNRTLSIFALSKKKSHTSSITSFITWCITKWHLLCSEFDLLKVNWWIPWHREWQYEDLNGIISIGYMENLKRRTYNKDLLVLVHCNGGKNL